MMYRVSYWLLDQLIAWALMLVVLGLVGYVILFKREYL
jgi:hypothetical protein